MMTWELPFYPELDGPFPHLIIYIYKNFPITYFFLHVDEQYVRNSR